jgi:hypothetical protein
MVDPTVCHIPPVVPSTQPSPINIPSIPPAEANIPSLQNTVNAMRQALQILLGQQGVQGTPGQPGRNAQSATGQFTESHRVTEVVRVFNPDDPTQFVDVERTNQLIMGNKATKQTWTYNRTRS